jgi:hypothetical protein
LVTYAEKHRADLSSAERLRVALLHIDSCRPADVTSVLNKYCLSKYALTSSEADAFLDRAVARIPEDIIGFDFDFSALGIESLEAIKNYIQKYPKLLGGLITYIKNHASLSQAERLELALFCVTVSSHCISEEDLAAFDLSEANVIAVCRERISNELSASSFLYRQLPLEERLGFFLRDVSKESEHFYDPRAYSLPAPLVFPSRDRAEITLNIPDFSDADNLQEMQQQTSQLFADIRKILGETGLIQSILFKEVVLRVDKFERNVRGSYDVIKFTRLMAWLSWSIINMLRQLEVTQITSFAAATAEKPQVLPEIVDYTDPGRRYILTKIYLEMFKNPAIAATFVSLCPSLSSRAKVLPALGLTYLLHNSSATVDSQLRSDAQSLLNELSIAVCKDGVKLRLMIHGWLALADCRRLTIPNKIAILTPGPCGVVVVEKLPSVSEVGAYSRLLEAINVRHGYVFEKNRRGETAAGSCEQTKKEENKVVYYLGVDGELVPLSVKHGKERSLRKFDKTVASLSKTDSDAITSMTGHSVVITSNIQRQCWFLCAALPVIAPFLNEENPTNLQLAYNRAMHALFGVTSQNMVFLNRNLSSQRNCESLLSYYAGLKTLSEREQVIFLPLLRRFVQQVATPQADSFYTERYNINTNLHLRTIFSEKPELLAKWQAGARYSYQIFVNHFKLNTVKPVVIDIVDFLANRILQHRHLDVVHFYQIYDYLRSTTRDAKEVVKGALVTEDQRDEASVAVGTAALGSRDRQNRVKIMLALITLLECYSSSSLQERLAMVTVTIRHLNRSSGNCELTYDLSMVQKVLHAQTIPPRVTNTDDWKAIDTDHYWHLFMLGTDVEGSCQRIGGDPKFNKCLIGGYVLSGHIRAIAITDGENKIVARAILRLTWDAKLEQPVLFLEEIYPFTATSEQKAVIVTMAKLRARSLRVALVNSDGDYTMNAVPYPNPLEVKSVVGAEYVDATHNQHTEPYTIGRAYSIFMPGRLDPILNRKQIARQKEARVQAAAHVRTQMARWEARALVAARRMQPIFQIKAGVQRAMSEGCLKVALWQQTGKENIRLVEICTADQQLTQPVIQPDLLHEAVRAARTVTSVELPTLFLALQQALSDGQAKEVFWQQEADGVRPVKVTCVDGRVLSFHYGVVDIDEVNLRGLQQARGGLRLLC